MSTVHISCSNLWTHAEDPHERAPLSALERDGAIGHIHGLLTIEIAGRPVPHLGYWGPDDVCLDAWVVELCRAVHALDHGPREHVFDEGEQGQPAFKFERQGPDVIFSIVESSLSGGSADSEWQGVRFSYGEFRAAVVAFLEQLRSQLRAQAPLEEDRWWPKDASLDTPTP
jgi:hypothetical protein